MNYGVEAPNFGQSKQVVKASGVKALNLSSNLPSLKLLLTHAFNTQVENGQSFESLFENSLVEFQTSGNTVTVSGDGNQDPAVLTTSDISAGKVGCCLSAKQCDCLHDRQCM